MQDPQLNLTGEIVTVRPEHSIDTIQHLPNYVGISQMTAGARGISMNIVVIPPAAKAQPHYHQGFEMAIYLLKGEVQTFYGENLSPDTEAIALVARNDANEQESVRVYAAQASVLG
jgi:uncharacterized RmlC-like cupin family protein